MSPINGYLAKLVSAFYSTLIFLTYMTILVLCILLVLGVMHGRCKGKN